MFKCLSIFFVDGAARLCDLLASQRGMLEIRPILVIGSVGHVEAQDGSGWYVAQEVPGPLARRKPPTGKRLKRILRVHCC